MKKLFFILSLAMLPALNFAQDPLSRSATVLPSSGPSALEVAQQRMAYERSIQGAQSPVYRYKEPKPERMQIYDAVEFPMDRRWGSPTSKIPMSINVSQIEKLDNGIQVYVLNVRDALFTNLKIGSMYAEEFHMYFRNDSLAWVQVPMDPHRLKDRVVQAFGKEAMATKDDKGNEWFVWQKKGTAMAVVIGETSSAIVLYPMKEID